MYITEFKIYMKAFNNLNRPICRIWKETAFNNIEQLCSHLESLYFNIGWKDVKFYLIKQRPLEIKENKKIKYEQLTLF